MRHNAAERSDTRATIHPASRATPPSDDGRILLHLETGRMCAINSMGSRIWAELESGRTFQEIVDALAAEYEAPRDRIETDVRAFVQQLAEKDYVLRSGSRR